jgi:hypothetical protein
MFRFAQHDSAIYETSSSASEQYRRKSSRYTGGHILPVVLEAVCR